MITQQVHETDDGNKIVSDVTNHKHLVDVDFIQSLRDIADNLEKQNRLVYDSNS